MINIWKNSENGLTRSAILEKGCWIEVTNPNELEKTTLREEYKIPEDLILDIMDEDERPRIERFDESVCLITRVPVFDKTREVSYFTLPLGIIKTNSIIITICAQVVPSISDFTTAPGRIIDISNPASFVIQVLMRAMHYYLSFLKTINRQTGMIENELQQSVRNTELIGLLRLEKSLVFFTTSLRGNELLLEKFERFIFPGLKEKQLEDLEDLRTENRQAIEMTNIYSNILSGMMDAYASVISNNLNVVMKRLTLISIVLMIPTFVASLYGMNLSFLPFQNSRWAFFAILGLSAAMSVIGGFIISRTRRFKT